MQTNINVGQATPDNASQEACIFIKRQVPPDLLTTKSVKPRQAKPDLHDKRHTGFTLIELLVVVLIIGILAAVALPQYQKAVAKSRVSTIIPVGQAIWEAKETYYLANNEYVRDIDVLSLDVPTNCTFLGTGYYRCGKYFLLDNNPTNVTMNYCPEYLDNLAVCREHQDFRLVWVSQNDKGAYPQAGERYCAVHNDSKLGKEICKNLAGFTYGVAEESLP